MKLLFTLMLFLVHIVATEALAQTTQQAQPNRPAQKSQKVATKPQASAPTKQTPAKPAVGSTAKKHSSTPAQLKENQYSLDKDNKITVFKTTLYDELLLSEHCFPGQALGDKTTTKSQLKKPTCQAYTESLKTRSVKPEDKLETEFHNNLGSVHCKIMGGTGLIAKSHQNGESDFCLFKDGSMVSSWSSYYKSTHPGVNAKDQINK